MPITRFLLLSLGLVACSFGQSACAQVAATTVSAKRDHASQDYLPTSQSTVSARRDASGHTHVRVTVQYLLVDSETRSAIYKGLDRASLVSSVQIPPAANPGSLEESLSPTTSLQQILAPSRVTSCMLSESEFAGTIRKAKDAPHSEVNVAPKIILLDGNEVEMTDLVQRPFVVDFHGEGETVEPDVHALDEGTRLRLVARLIDSGGNPNQAIDLNCELTVLRLRDVETDQIFGLKDEPLTVQVPIQQINSAVVSRRLLVGQALLIDPHVSQGKRVESEKGIPMFGKLPYVGRVFKNVSEGVVEQHMMLILQPSIESAPQPQELGNQTQ